MDPIKITKKEETITDWRFVVELGPESNKIGFSVLLEKDDWMKLTKGQYSPDELVMRSFQFLLHREPKTSIARNFYLKDIQKDFSSYEGSMRV